MDTGTKIAIGIGIWFLMSIPMAILMGKWIKFGTQEAPESQERCSCSSNTDEYSSKRIGIQKI